MIESSMFTANVHLQTLGWVLLNFIWQGFLLAGVLKGLLSVTRWCSATFRYNMALAVLIAMLSIPVISFLKPQLPQPGTQPENKQTEVMPYSVQITSGDRQEVNSYDITGIKDSTALGTELLTFVQHLLPWLCAFWLTGVLVASIRALGGVMKVLHVKRGAKEFSGDIDLPALARKSDIRSQVELFETSRVTVPSVAGWFKPVILLPEGNRFPPEQAEALVAHELAHVRRRDHLVNLFQMIIEVLFFFHPAVWWVSSQVRIERESCCDDAAILACGNVTTYVRSLTEAERQRSVSRWAVAASGASLLNRIRRITEMKNKPVNRLVAWSVMIFGVSLIIIAASGSSLLAYVPIPFQMPAKNSLEMNPKVDSLPLLVSDVRSMEPVQAVATKAQSAPSEEAGSGQEDIITKIYTLSHARASELAQTLESVLGDKFKVIAHPQTNSLVVTCAKEMNRKINELIKFLDTPSPQTSEIRVYALSHAPAPEVAQVLEETFSEHPGKPVIKVDTGTNSLIVARVNTEDYVILDEMIKKLDIPSNQASILVESMIVEVALSELDKLGAIGNSMIYSPKELAELRKKIQSGEIKAKILLSNPKLLTLNKKESRISTGGKVHYMEKTGDGLYKPKALETPIGLQLSITPTILEERISMDINIQVTDMSGRLAVAEFPDLNIGKPTIRMREHTTNVVLKDGDTVVIGGMKADNSEEDKEVIAFITANIANR